MPVDAKRPYHDLACAIMERAVMDFRMLSRLGLVVDWKAANPYPDRHSKLHKSSNGYTRPHECDELCLFLRGGAAAEWLDMLGEQVGADEMCRAIGLKIKPLRPSESGGGNAD